MLYIRRLFHQDMTHQITANRDGSMLFFKYDYTKTPADRTVYFTYKDRGLYPSLEGYRFNGVLHPDSSETRINGEFKGFLISSLEAKEGDILLMWNNDKDITKYSLSIIKQTEDAYSYFAALLGRNNHSVSILEDEEKTDDFDDDFDLDDEDDVEESKLSKYRQYITAIKSKPFLLLAGISGTGKSRIVRELARACWDEGSEEYEAHKPSNFEMVQVKPNWHDSSELIGYISRVSGEPVYVAGDFLKFIVKAWANIDTPHFLCLDEMNLAPVEQYFAEYLSVVESRKNEEGEVVTDPLLKKDVSQWYINLVHELTDNEELTNRFLNDGICLPPNLIVVGTVNMDETTFSFSRKVLDRAMTIEMNEVDLNGGLDKRHESIGKLGAKELLGKAVEGYDIYPGNEKVCNNVIEYLEAINEELEGTPFKIAYRTRNEFLLYAVHNLPYNQIEGDSEHIYKEEFVIARAIDEITSMKILSRIEGDESKVSVNFLKKLSEVIKEKLDEISGLEFGINNTDDVEKSVSLAKLDEMTKRLEASGYTSFWS